MRKLYFSSNVLNISFSQEPNYILLKPGQYLFEAYGASGGGGTNADTTSRIPNKQECLDQNIVTKFEGNTICRKDGSQPGAGGYSRGIFTAKSTTPIYVLTGGKGNYGQGEKKGGFNGGGSACATKSSSGSGGGATDFRVFYNSLYSRILVAGGGGGSDDFAVASATNPYMGSNDGSGGSGGLPGQAMWEDGYYKGSDYETTTTKGFSFGQGQRSKLCSAEEKAGAGGGFFGGFTIDSYSSGAGGGSSFAFSSGIAFPTTAIEAKDENGVVQEKTYYMFKDKPEYYLTSVDFATGIWSGNGFARITILHLFQLNCCTKLNNFFISPIMICILIL